MFDKFKGFMDQTISVEEALDLLDLGYQRGIIDSKYLDQAKNAIVDYAQEKGTDILTMRDILKAEKKIPFSFFGSMRRYYNLIKDMTGLLESSEPEDVENEDFSFIMSKSFFTNMMKAAAKSGISDEGIDKLGGVLEDYAENHDSDFVFTDEDVSGIVDILKKEFGEDEDVVYDDEEEMDVEDAEMSLSDYDEYGDMLESMKYMAGLK